MYSWVDKFRKLLNKAITGLGRRFFLHSAEIFRKLWKYCLEIVHFHIFQFVTHIFIDELSPAHSFMGLKGLCFTALGSCIASDVQSGSGWLRGWLVSGCSVGNQSVFVRQWNLAPVSCTHMSSQQIDVCAKTPLFDVEPLGPYTNDCHVALEVCLSICLFVCLSVFLCLCFFNL